MINFLIKKFIKDNEDIKNPKVREDYGVFTSIISIILNGILVIFKISIGIISNSIAIQADGLNNLSDCGSNIACLFGFRMANKHADEDHPYGHGRMEYIAGMVIAFLILLVGFQSLKDSVLKVIYPSKVIFSTIAVIILIFSILVKFFMAHFNKIIGNKINSSTLKAAATDSINDVITTSFSLLALILSLYTDLPVDGIFGCVVSIFVLKAGIDVLKDVSDPLLGKAPDKELIDSIVKEVRTNDMVLGIHDLIMHDYGPGRRFLTLHIEVDGNQDVYVIHDAMDLIERDIHEKYHIITTVHMDPIDTKDKRAFELKEKVDIIVKNINSNYSIHDFRMVAGPTHANIIFDILIPAGDTTNHQQLKDKVDKELKKINPNYFTVIQIDHNYI
ncbi:MAG: cation diffusion facilitator family transporter [Thomasclavelia sp.]|nr:cation diffusion facilitator family transporter [Thomasclavelia sp.]